MAVNGLAGFHGSAVHPTRVLRNLASTLLAQPPLSHANAATATTRGGCYGVASGGDLAVTVTTGLGFSIAAGRLAGPGTTALAQGAYVGYNDAAVVSAVGARNATNPRIDYVAWRVRDTDEDATGAEDDGLIVIAGTAAASPVAPTLSAGQGTLVVLCEILVPSTANGGPIAITDRRAFLTAVGGIQRCSSTNRPTSLAVWAGLHITETDTGRDFKRNTANTAWELVHGRARAQLIQSGQSFTSGLYAGVTWSSEVQDTDGFFPGSGAVVTIPTGFAGTYVVTFEGFSSVTTSGISVLEIVQNATIRAEGVIQVGRQRGSVTQAMALAAGDTVSCNVLNGHSATVFISGTLDLHRTGP